MSEFNLNFYRSIRECLENDPKHYDFIADRLDLYGNIVFSWSPDKVSAYVVSLGVKHHILNNMVYGGPFLSDMITVGVRTRGFNFFEIKNCAEGLHIDYLIEKLDCGDIAPLLKEVCQRLLNAKGKS